MDNRGAISLGDMLRNKIAADAKAAVEEQQSKERKQQEKDADELRCVTEFYDMARTQFTNAIASGRKPEPIKVHSSGENSRVASLLETYNQSPDRLPKNSPFRPAWEAFDSWATENGLRAVWSYDHDGVGIQSWYWLSVQPA